MTTTTTRAEKLAAWKADHPFYVELAEKYGQLLVNTGGNDPLELVADLDLDKNMMTTNVIRFVLAVGVQSQLLVLGKTGTRAEGAPNKAAVVEAVRLAQQNDGGYGMTRGAAERVWHYLTQPADPREGEVRRDVECCPGKTCTTDVVRRAGMWVRTSNGEVWHDPEEQA